MQMRKKIVSLLMASTMTLTMLPTMARAQGVTLPDAQQDRQNSAVVQAAQIPPLAADAERQSTEQPAPKLPASLLGSETVRGLILLLLAELLCQCKLYRKRRAEQAARPVTEAEPTGRTAVCPQARAGPGNVVLQNEKDSP